MDDYSIFRPWDIKSRGIDRCFQKITFITEHYALNMSYFLPPKFGETVETKVYTFCMY